MEREMFPHLQGKMPGLHQVQREGLTEQQRMQNAAYRLTQQKGQQYTVQDVLNEYGYDENKAPLSIQQTLTNVERILHPEMAVDAVPYDAHVGGTGTHLAKPLNLSHLTGGNTQDTLDLLYQLKKFKRQHAQEIKDKATQATRQSLGERTPEHPVQFVRECEQAGPGWTYCDPTIPGECPDKSLLVGTPYENVYSAEVGIPPNNKVVMCVPPELVKIGGKEFQDEQKNSNADERLARALRKISEESENIYKLAGWKSTAPCDAISQGAIDENPNVCSNMFFKKERIPNRCISKEAHNLLSDKSDAEKASMANTCYSNPDEYLRKMQIEVFRIKRLRQALRLAVDDAMQVSDFVNKFNQLASNKEHESYRMDVVDNQDMKTKSLPLTWDVVKWYMTDSTDGIDMQDLAKLRLRKWDCDKSIKALHRLKGGGQIVATPSELGDLSAELKNLETLEAGGPNECLDSRRSACNARLRKVLRTLSRLLKAESSLQDRYDTWREAHKKMLDSLERDAKCEQRKTNPKLCENLKGVCNFENCPDNEEQEEDLRENCIDMPGNQSVDKRNEGITWTIESVTDEGIPVNFQWVVHENFRELRNNMVHSSLRSCAGKNDITIHDVEQMRKKFQDKQSGVLKTIQNHYPRTYQEIFGRKYQDAVERDAANADIQEPLTQTIRDTLRQVLQEMQSSQDKKVGEIKAEDLGVRPRPKMGAVVNVQIPTWARKEILGELITQLGDYIETTIAGGGTSSETAPDDVKGVEGAYVSGVRLKFKVPSHLNAKDMQEWVKEWVDHVIESKKAEIFTSTATDDERSKMVKALQKLARVSVVSIEGPTDEEEAADYIKAKHTGDSSGKKNDDRKPCEGKEINENKYIKAKCSVKATSSD